MEDIMSTAPVIVRDLTDGMDNMQIDVADMPPGELTVQHILDSAGVATAKTAVLVNGTRVTDMSAMVAPGSEILAIPQVANG